MYAERLILETNLEGKLKKLPKLPANKKIEAIFLVIDDAPTGSVKRTPHSDITGKVKIMGDLFNTVPTTDWDFTQ